MVGLPSAIRYLGRIALLALVYALVVEMGNVAAATDDLYAIPFFASGIGLGAVLLGGPKLAPAVAIGAAAACFAVGMPITAAVAVGLGQAAAAVVAAAAMRRWGIDPKLERIADVFILLALGAGIAATISATVAALTVDVGPALAARTALWSVWWLGEAVGILLVAPVVLTWWPPPRLDWPRGLAEGGSMVIANLIVAAISFEILGVVDIVHPPFAFFIFPPLIWAALRFGQRGASVAIVIVAFVALWQTARDMGPFGGAEPLEALLLLESFAASFAITTLLLAAAVNERTAAARADAAKSRFLAALRHDMSQPLQAARLFTDVLAAGLRHDERNGAVLGRLRGTLDTMAEELSAIRDIGRIETSEMDIAPETFTLDRLMDQLSAEFAPQARAKGLAFSYVPCRVAIHSDRHLLGRVLRNLLSNAIRYTSKGAILFGCRRRQGIISVEVWDTGCGIPAEEQRRVFEEFHRIRHPGTTAEGGLGLGLAIVERIAKLLGHTVRLRSAPGKGSVFSVEIPAYRQTQADDSRIFME